MSLFRFFTLFAAALGFACNAVAKPTVVAAQPLLADFANVVGGDDITLSCLLNAAADPHSYEPSPTDLRLLVQADLVIVNGLGLDPWVDQVVNNSGFHGRVVVASEACPVRLPVEKNSPTQTLDPHGSANSDAHAEWDPHAWHDPANARSYVLKIRDALKAAAPLSAKVFDDRAATYLARIAELDRYARGQFGTLPDAQRELVTSHDSLRYLAHAYSLKIVPIAGSRPDQEPSARELAELISFIKKQNVRAVFFEATSSPALAQLVAEEAHVAVVRQLCTDGLGAPNSATGTYLGMFRTNVDTIVGALH